MRFGFLFLMATSLLIVGSCKVTRLQVTERQGTFIQIDSTLPVDAGMARWLVPYRLRMDSIMDVVIGQVAVPMSKAQPESTMGNFMADAQLQGARELNPHTQVAIMNYGGIRIPYVRPGPITKGKIYEMMPFDNKLVIMEVPGKVMRQFCDLMATYGGWPVAGINFDIRGKEAINIQIDGRPLNEQVIYTTAISDYIANGGDNCSFLAGSKRRDYNVFVRDMLIDYITKLQSEGKLLQPQLEQRIKYAE